MHFTKEQILTYNKITMNSSTHTFKWPRNQFFSCWWWFKSRSKM